MVYLHKTTRSAEQMLAAVLQAVAQSKFSGKGSGILRSNPVVRYVKSRDPLVRDYIELDDSSIWAALAEFSKSSLSDVAALAQRLRDRQLYKCLDAVPSERVVTGKNLWGRFRDELGERPDLSFDIDGVTLYKEYDFDHRLSLNKVLVKTNPSESEPTDIVDVSAIIRASRDAQRIRRVYANDQTEIDELADMLRGITSKMQGVA